MRVDDTELKRVCDETLAALSYELVALEWTRGQQGNVLRVFLDRPEAPGQVSLEDCSRASRDLSAALDVADLIPYAYSLEVSSPGLDRPLTKERDFERFAGHTARVRTKEPVDGRRNFKGTIRGAREGRALIECDGRTYELQISDVAKANLEYEFPNRGR